MSQPLWRQTAGLWGPGAFVAATVIGGASQPDYDHRRLHISGLAAHGARSAPVMVPGFITLGVAGLVIPASGPARPLLRAAGDAAGRGVPVQRRALSRPDPRPGRNVRSENAMHAAVSIATFIVWTALPFVDASQSESTRARIGNLVLGVITAAGLAGAAATARSDDRRKGVAQRFFLGSVFARYVATAARAIRGRTAALAALSGTGAK